MIKIRNLIGIASVFCVLAVLAMPASALPQDADSEDRVTMISGHLDKLESEGYDVSAMRTALENEDIGTLRELMKEFMDGHNIELGSSENGEGRGHVRNDNGILDKLESEGYDVSAMKTALENGDMETFHSLMKDFMEVHRDELDLPENGEGQGPGMKGGDANTHLDKLESEGYDVSEMRTALENGDMETFHSLMKDFMEEHRDELDLPEKREGRGPGMKIVGGDE